MALAVLAVRRHSRQSEDAQQASFLPSVLLLNLERDGDL